MRDRVVVMLAVVGGVWVAAGVAMLSVAAGCIVAGLLMLAASWWADR